MTVTHLLGDLFRSGGLFRRRNRPWRVGLLSPGSWLGRHVVGVVVGFLLRSSRFQPEGPSGTLRATVCTFVWHHWRIVCCSACHTLPVGGRSSEGAQGRSRPRCRCAKCLVTRQQIQASSAAFGAFGLVVLGSSGDSCSIDDRILSLGGLVSASFGPSVSLATPVLRKSNDSRSAGAWILSIGCVP